MRFKFFCLIATPILFLSGVSSAVFGAADPNSYWKAAQAKTIVDALKQPNPPSRMKEFLLNKAREEDRAFVKSMLVFWKKNSEHIVQTEFDQILIHDRQGREVLRMAPVENETGKFEINGAIWQIPTAGSISRSLQTVLAKNSESKNSRLDLIAPRAFAAGEVTPAAAAAYTYAFASDAGMLLAPDHLKVYSPKANLLRTESEQYGKILDAILRQPIVVRCSAASVSGRVRISNEPVDFTVTKDGSVHLVHVEMKHPFKVTSETTRPRGGKVVLGQDLVFSPCTDTTCSETGPAKHSLRSFLPIQKPDEVGVALTFRAQDSEKSAITYACEDPSDCEVVEINGYGEMNERDKRYSVQYRDEANRALAKLRHENAEVIRGIRPLYECCQQSVCRDEVLGLGVKLVPAQPPPTTTSRATTR